jgi:PIN domain nuclease of toxin-antitoxin system
MNCSRIGAKRLGVTVPDRPFVLDASAVLALLQGEAGADQVEPMLDGALMSCVNLAEVLQKAEQHDVDSEGLEHDLEALGIDFRGFEAPDARGTVARWIAGTGLSLGDRACLALAATVGGTAVTTERGWIEATNDVSVTAIR